MVDFQEIFFISKTSFYFLCIVWFYDQLTQRLNRTYGKALKRPIKKSRTKSEHYKMAFRTPQNVSQCGGHVFEILVEINQDEFR